jgi:hypothetical protein
MFDLCCSIEVAEHLPEESADVFVETLCGLSNTIFFTAAVENQGGHGHINEQPNEYWIEKFSAFGFKYKEALTKQMRQEMNDNKVVWWISNNLMIFRR